MERIHITGASGSGTTTLGCALAGRLGWRHLDSDDFFWIASEPPFQEKREAGLRAAMLRAALADTPRWVLSGSVMGWTGLAAPDFDLVIFLDLPTALRMARLEAREIERYGTEALAPGGDRYAESQEFLAWAAAYDDAETVGRNRVAHKRWLADLACPVLRLDSTRALRDNVETVLARLQQR
jgi:adenylate kinase family enzyme